MADKETAGKKSWLKAVFGTVGGLVSGAAVMYVTAGFNQLVKPAKPVANFKFDSDGLNVKFQNLSGAGQGWWDFGDGSPLEPVNEREFVTHAYPRPGEYTAKLSLHNLLGEETERSVAIHLGAAASANGDMPQVASLEAVPVSPGSYAPATFKLVSKVQNAQLCVLDCGDERPLEVLPDPSNAHERLVTFHQPGGHLIKLVAINGSHLDHKTEIVNVEEAPVGSVTAMLTVTDKATRVLSSTRVVAVPLDRTATASPGFQITEVSVATANKQEIHMKGQKDLALDAAALGLKGAKNLHLKLADDSKSVKLTGEAPKDSKGQPQAVALILTVTEEQRQSAGRDEVAGTTTVALPANGQSTIAEVALPTVPKDWVDVQRQVRLKVVDGDKVLWEGSQLPRGATISAGKRRYVLGASVVNYNVRVDLREAVGLGGSAN